MKLETYLDKIKSCPDEYLRKGQPDAGWRITREFGVYDNYHMWILTNGIPFVPRLSEMKFVSTKAREQHDSTYTLADYIPGTALMQITQFHQQRVFPCSSDERRATMTPFQYDTAIVVHNYQKREMPKTHWLKALAFAISDVSLFAKNSGMNVCLSDSCGWDDLNNADKVVYHPNSLRKRK